MEQTERKVRLAISGAAGSGKTTLAEDLAQRLGIPLLQENWAPISQTREDYFDINQNTLRGVEERREALENWKLAYKTWLEARYEELSHLNEYVSDLWAADAYSNWLRVFMNSTDDRMALYLLKKMREHSRLYNFFILLPVTRELTEEHNSDSLKREPSLHIRLMANGLTAGLISHYLKRPIIEIPSRKMTREERVEFVLERTNLVSKPTTRH